jgi:hypothetical protein
MQSVAHQGGTVSARPARGLIGGLQQLSVKHDLDNFHMWIILHSGIHSL